MAKLDLASFQQQFSSHLLSDELGHESDEFLALLEPKFGAETASEEAAIRVGIYRNNVVHSLSRALGDMYPVIKRLVGDDCFNVNAVDFVRQQPPKQADLSHYGKAFIEFIAQQPTLSELLFLPDVARLEYAHNHAFHSGDVAALELAELGKIAPEQLGELSFSLHPSATLFSSQWPVDSIWHENLKQQPQTLDMSALGGCHLLIYRLELEVKVVDLDHHCYLFLTELSLGSSINIAWHNVLQSAPSLGAEELSPMLGYLLNLSVFTHCELNPSAT